MRREPRRPAGAAIGSTLRREPSLRRPSSRARLSPRTFTPGSPRKPRDATVGVVLDEGEDGVQVQAPLVGHPRAPAARALAIEMWGSSAGAGRGHGIDGHRGVGGETVRFPVGGDGVGHAGRGSPGWSAQVGGTGGDLGRVVGVAALGPAGGRARRRRAGRGSTAGWVKAWPSSEEPTTSPSWRTREPSASSSKATWATQGDGQGVEDAGQDGEDEHGPQAGQQLLADTGHDTPIAVRTTSMALIPTKGAIRPPTP